MRELLHRGLKWREAAIAALAFAVVAPAGARGADSAVVHACVHKGSLRVRIVGSIDACRPGETPVVWNVAGAPGPAGPEGPEGPQGEPGPGAVLVVDSRGAVVGTLIDCCDVIVRAGDARIMLPVEAGGFSQTRVFFYFESADCTGTPLLPRVGLLSRTVVIGTTAYYATDFQDRPVQSEKFGGGCFLTDSPGPTGPVSSVDLSGFAPPFSAQ